MNIWIRNSVAGLFLLASTPLVADGVLEINQTCALNGGCFAGDSAGFPVEITSPGSYRLTSNLNLTSIPNTIAIQIDGPHVTLDLGGFEIAGPITCTGSGSTLDCGTPGSATGIRLNGGADGTLIRNGTIRNMDSSGVGSSGSSRETLENLRAYNNARNGFSVGNSSIISSCIAVENGDNGFDLGIASVVDRATAEGNGGNGFESPQKVVVKNSTTRRNGGRGYNLGPSSRFGDNTSDFNSEPDRCGGGICSETKRFYVTRDQFVGSEALNACQEGFHMASIFELLGSSQWRYDTVLGQNRSDAGVSVPSVSGWVRTGEGGFENLNCDTWTSNQVNDFGQRAKPTIIEDWNDPAREMSPWPTISTRCNVLTQVWCVED